uniref:Uncharacterized protein n=1 Tax=Arundo donax TaxID=35708 RepID=A0A0A8Y0S8_ARUDO
MKTSGMSLRSLNFTIFLMTIFGRHIAAFLYALAANNLVMQRKNLWKAILSLSCNISILLLKLSVHV